MYRRGYAGHLILLGCSVIRRYTKIGGPLPHRATPQLLHPPCTLIHAAFNLAFPLPLSTPLLVSLANDLERPATDSSGWTRVRVRVSSQPGEHGRPPNIKNEEIIA